MKYPASGVGFKSSILKNPFSFHTGLTTNLLQDIIQTTPAYLVSGKGSNDALYTASHGAGRAMSRQKAKDSMTVSAMKKLLTNAGVTLIGGTVEENPLAYKDIESIIAAQHDLVDIQGKFYPHIIRMNKG